MSEQTFQLLNAAIQSLGKFAVLCLFAYYIGEIRRDVLEIKRRLKL